MWMWKATYPVSSSHFHSELKLVSEISSYKYCTKFALCTTSTIWNMEHMRNKSCSIYTWSWNSYHSDTGSSLFNNTTITAHYFAAPLSALQFLHPVYQYFPVQREEAVWQQDLPGSKTTVYRQSPNFIHNLFLKTCRKV